MKCDLECAVLAAVCLVAVFVWIHRGAFVLLVRWLKLWKLPVLFSAAVLSFVSMATTPMEAGRIFFVFFVPITIALVALRNV